MPQHYTPVATLPAMRANRRLLLKHLGAGGLGLAATGLVACGSSKNAANNAASSKPTIQSIGAPAPGTSPVASAAATAASAASPAVLKRGGISYGAGSGGVATTLSPNSSALWASEFYALYDQLARLEPSGDLAPGLALSWSQQQPDRWIFKLRTTTWSDGQPFTADDVKFTVDYVSDPNNKSALIARTGAIKSVDVIDPQTVAINTKGIDPLLLRQSFLLHILPKHILSDASQGDQALATKPVGTGAYVLDSYTQGSEIKLKRNPTSWRGTKGVDNVDIKLITEDETRVSAFQAGQLDVIDQVPYADFARVQGFKNTALASPPATGYQGYDIEYFTPPFNDKRVRLAINMAFDYAAIQKSIYYGVPKIMQGQMLTSATFGFDPNLKQYAYDPEGAKALLQQAGVNNLSLTMEYVGASPIQKTVSEACADFLRKIGINVNLSPIDITVWRDGLYGRRHRAELMFDSWSASAALEASIALQWMLSTNAGKFYSNPAFDAAYNAAITEPDDAKRRADYQKAVDIMHNDPPGSWIIEASQPVAYRSDKLAGFNAVGAPPVYFDELVLA